MECKTTTFIYALCEPNGKIRYIGKANDPVHRFKEHLTESINHRSHLGYWLKSLVSLGEKPLLETLDEVSVSQWAFWEREYIRVFRAVGINLVNTSDGGEGVTLTGAQHPLFGKTRSPETRAKIGAAQTGELHHMFGKKHPPESRAKMSKAITLALSSPEIRAKMSAAKVGKKQPKETIAKRIATRASNKSLKEARQA